MSIKTFTLRFIEKVYYFAAAVVISGLICQQLGLAIARNVTVAGLFMEAAVFFFGLFKPSSVDDDDEKKNKDDKNENKRFYYTDGAGNYYLGRPQPNVVVGGIGNTGRLPYNVNGDFVNGPAESFHFPDLDTEIGKLKDKIDLLELIKKDQLDKLTKENRNSNNVNKTTVTRGKKEALSEKRTRLGGTKPRRKKSE